MEKKEREILDRLKDTFRSVEEQESKIKTLQRNGKRRNMKETKSVVAQYISSPTKNNPFFDMEDFGDSTQNRQGNATFKNKAQSPTGRSNNRNNVTNTVHPTAETGQERNGNQ